MQINAGIRDIESGKALFEKENATSSVPLTVEYGIPRRATSINRRHTRVIKAGRVLMGRSLVCLRVGEFYSGDIS